MKKLFLVSIFLMSVLMSSPLMACIAFVAEDGDTVLVGNNEDWFEKYPIELKFEQSDNGFPQRQFLKGHPSQFRFKQSCNGFPQR